MNEQQVRRMLAAKLRVEARAAHRREDWSALKEALDHLERVMGEASTLQFADELEREREGEP
jgi:hypothetical protein